MKRYGAASAIATAGIVALFVILPLPAAAAGTFLTLVLTWLAAIDIERRLLPDVLTYPLIATGIALAAWGIGPSVWSSLGGAMIGYGVIALVAHGYRAARGFDGIGFGDAKLLAALGAWAGAAMLPPIVLIAALAGLTAYSFTRPGTAFDLRAELPFGPFLAAAGWGAYVALHAGFDVSRLLADAMFGLSLQ